MDTFKYIIIKININTLQLIEEIPGSIEKIHVM